MLSQISQGSTYRFRGTIHIGTRDILKITRDHLILTRKEEYDTGVGIEGDGKSGFVIS